MAGAVSNYWKSRCDRPAVDRDGRPDCPVWVKANPLRSRAVDLAFGAGLAGRAT